MSYPHDPASGPQSLPNQPAPPPPPYGVPGYGPVRMPPPVDNNLGWAIGGLLVCWPFGIPSLIKSLQVQNLWMQGFQEQAERSAAEAKKWGKIGIIVGASFLGLYVVGMIVYVFFMIGLLSSMGMSSM